MLADRGRTCEWLAGASCRHPFAPNLFNETLEAVEAPACRHRRRDRHRRSVRLPAGGVQDVISDAIPETLQLCLWGWDLEHGREPLGRARARVG